MNSKEFNEYCQEKIKEYPHLKDDILNIYDLAHDEIEQGGSEVHELSLAVQSIKDLISDENG